jgi:methylenetetrahydrofolate reductase (NADPH)
MNLNEKLETGKFLLSFELVPGKSSRGKDINKTIEFAKKAANDQMLDALTLTDNPGGNPRLSPDVLGAEIGRLGTETIVHFACRDWNRLGAVSRALQLARLGIENLLVVTGDYPAAEPAGTAKPCFDMDSTSAICMLDAMNNPEKNFCGDAGESTREKTNFTLGAAVACDKKSEAETICQYFKLLRKISNGANFAITQICFDARRFEELRLFLDSKDAGIPLIGSAFALNPRSARFIASGSVPGASLPRPLLEEVLEESKKTDGGKSASLERCARLAAVLKGLGYRGAHFAGPLTYEELKTIVTRLAQIENQWQSFLPQFDYPRSAGFYLYEKDEATGLNSKRPARKKHRSPAAWAAWGGTNAFHGAMFDRNSKLYPRLKKIAAKAEKSKTLGTAVSLVEDAAKKILFNCKKCGDCALPDTAYLCPESQCPKFMRNGPCGGSRKTRCEVRKERTCVWVRAYERLKSHRIENRLAQLCIPPRNWALNQTSSWLNYWLGRDYHGRIECNREQHPE